jgi:hypothetical protein
MLRNREAIKKSPKTQSPHRSFPGKTVLRKNY